MGSHESGKNVCRFPANQSRIACRCIPTKNPRLCRQERTGQKSKKTNHVTVTSCQSVQKSNPHHNGNVTERVGRNDVYRTVHELAVGPVDVK